MVLILSIGCVHFVILIALFHPTLGFISNPQRKDFSWERKGLQQRGQSAGLQQDFSSGLLSDLGHDPPWCIL